MKNLQHTITLKYRSMKLTHAAKKKQQPEFGDIEKPKSQIDTFTAKGLQLE